LKEELDSMTTVMGRLNENLKAKKQEVSQYTLETPTPQATQPPRTSAPPARPPQTTPT